MRVSLESDKDSFMIADYVRVLISYRVWILKTVAIAVSISLLHALIAPKQYHSYVTFFVNTEDSAGNLGSYAKFLGISNSDPLSSKLNALIHSRRLRMIVAEHMYSSVTDYEKLTFKEETPMKARYETILSKLKVHKRLDYSSQDKDFYKISMLHPDPEIAQLTVRAYLEAISQLNIELQLSPKKELYTVLDTPRVPKTHYSPQLKKQVPLMIILGLFVGVFTALAHARRYYFLSKMGF